MMDHTTVDCDALIHLERDRDAWSADVDGRRLRLTNLDKIFWRPEGYTKADVIAYYADMARYVLPYVRDRPLTLKRMPNGADGDFFYAKQAPPHTPEWVRTAGVVSRDSGKRIDYLLADDRASLVWLANLGCIELHPWHSRVDALGRPDYAFFDLDPFDVGFDVVRDVALHVHVILERLGLRGYPRTSGATGMQVYVPLDRSHSYAQVREWVGRVCALINRADPDRTTMEWDISKRSGRVFLDHNMNTEGKNIAATWSLRPERAAPVATPLRWEEVSEDILPTDFTIVTARRDAADRAEILLPILEGGQNLRASMAMLGMDDTPPDESGHALAGSAPSEEPGELRTYTGMRDFNRTPEPAAGEVEPGGEPGRRFVIQHHLATRLHHDLRLERGGTARSWAVPKGLPDVPGVPHLAVQTEDHPLSYMTFSGEIPEGEYGAGAVRIWDSGSYETIEWSSDKVTFALDGARHQGVWHLFRRGGDARADQWMITRRAPAEQRPPPPPQLAPMLAGNADEPFDDPDWVFEVKWDGVRAVATVARPTEGNDGYTRLVSRNGNDITPAYPEIASLWERVLARNAVLDGELVALRPDGTPSFERLQRRMHVREARTIDRLRRELPVSFVVFDVLAVDGEALIDYTLTDRLDVLKGLVVPGGPFVLSQAVPEHGRDLYGAVKSRGLEGVIAKRLSSTYRPGRRSRDWLKIKVRRRVCCVVGGWLPGESSLSGRLGSLLVGLHEDGILRFVGAVGSGLDESLRAMLEAETRSRATDSSPFAASEEVPRGARFVAPELVCEVEFAEVTDTKRLRAPSFKGLRPDIDPATCTLDGL